jgi:hypothetical protein
MGEIIFSDDDKEQRRREYKCKVDTAARALQHLLEKSRDEGVFITQVLFKKNRFSFIDEWEWLVDWHDIDSFTSKEGKT